MPRAVCSALLAGPPPWAAPVVQRHRWQAALRHRQVAAALLLLVRCQHLLLAVPGRLRRSSWQREKATMQRIAAATAVLRMPRSAGHACVPAPTQPHACMRHRVGACKSQLGLDCSMCMYKRCYEIVGPFKAHRKRHFAWCPSCDIRMNNRAYLAADQQCSPPEHVDMLWPV
jgi:hypothetical protein